ncbi:MAG: acyloxyacyl hydrolase [Gemmatimonadaceae bacterium]|nr:acyloxyacyl hydrolase [Gemmatimonadaceae bacterium]
MRRFRAGVKGVAMAMLGFAPFAALAQGASAGAPDSANALGAVGTAPHAGPLPLPFRGGPLITGYTAWAGSAFSMRTASNNEKFAGAALQLMGVQLSRSLFVRKGIQFTWLVEMLPVMSASVGAPVNRLPTSTKNADAFRDPVRFARYTLHDAYGAGIAPFGAELSRPLLSRLSAVYNVTAGAAFFSAVIPYGKATQANFTAATSVALEWRVTQRYAVSSGYNLHHLSNMSFGAANPGLNSHVLFMRVSKARFR